MVIFTLLIVFLAKESCTMYNLISGVAEVMLDPLKDFLNSPVQCSSVSEDEVDVFPNSIPRVLLMKGLPEKIPHTSLRMCLETLFKNAGQHEVTMCVIEGAEAYIKFASPAGTCVNIIIILLSLNHIIPSQFLELQIHLSLSLIYSLTHSPSSYIFCSCSQSSEYSTRKRHLLG